MDTTH